MRFKHSRMHRDNRTPGISKPSRGPGPSPNPLKNLKTLLPQSQPQNPAHAPPRPAYNNAAPPANYDPQQQQGAPKRPWGPNRAHYPPLPLPIPTLFSILLAWKAISLPRDKPLPWSRLFKVLSISPIRRPYHRRVSYFA